MRKSSLSAAIAAICLTTILSGCATERVTASGGTSLPNWPARFDQDALPSHRKGDDARLALARERATAKINRRKAIASKAWYLKLRKEMAK